MRLSATAARMRSFKADSSTLSPSWMSMARLTFPSRLELNRPVGSFNAAPLANVILTTLLYVPPVQTMPPWDQTGVPIHFHSSTISGSASCMMARAFASVFPRQSPSSLIFWSINAEADFTGTGLFMYNSNSRTYFSCAQRNVRPPQVKAATRRLKVLCNILLGRSFRNKSSKDMAFPHPHPERTIAGKGHTWLGDRNLEVFQTGYRYNRVSECSIRCESSEHSNVWKLIS